MIRQFQTIFTILAIAFATASVVAQPPGGHGGQRPGGPPQAGPTRGGLNDSDPGRSVLQALDTDGNHEISAEEIANAATSLKKLDVNADGKLTDDDLSTAGRGQARNRQDRQGAGDRRSGDRVRQPGRQQGQRGAGVPPSPDQIVERAMEFDTDNDGKLDTDELRKFAEQFGSSPREPERRRGDGESQGGRPQRPSRPDR